MTSTTVPAKSQPLHNFALPHLQWNNNQPSNSHHRGRSAKFSEYVASPSQVGPAIRQSQAPLLHTDQSPNAESLQSQPLQPPIREHQPCLSPMREQQQRQSPLRGGDMASESSKRNSAAGEGRNLAFESSPDRAPGKLEKNHVPLETEHIGKIEGRKKIVLKLPRKNRGEEIQEDPKADEVQEEGKLTAAVDKEASEEPAPKIWNLRPRKQINKSGGSAMIDDTIQSPHRTAIRPDAELNISAKEKKRKFSIALSKEEIEEDIFALTGSKPARRPMKRPKQVQKQLDTLFPGLWLGSITPNSYKVSENSLKGL